MLAKDGTVLGERAFPHSGDGLGQLLDWIISIADCDAGCIAAAIEVPHGPVVDSLLDRDLQVYSINPKQLDRFRDRFSPAGAKDDRLDARVLADAIRTDPNSLRALDALDPETIRLREWSRMSDELTAQRTRRTNRFREQLWRYYPQFLQLKVDLAAPWVLELWKLAPTPERARRVRHATIAKLLKKHRIRRFKAEDILDILRSKPVTVARGVVEASTDRINIAVQQLELLHVQISDAKRSIDKILEKLSASQDPPTSEDPPAESPAAPAEDETTPSEQSSPPSDVAILSSLPGVGNGVLATLLSEAPGLLRARDYQALRCLCGVAPVTQRSGKSHRVIRRRACQLRLVNSVYHWSRVAAIHDPTSRAKYQALRGRGHSHGRALRSVGDRLLAVACAMLREGTPFDPDRCRQSAPSTAPQSRVL